MSVENTRKKFWERFDLSELTHAEWEALCDGCGKCCTLKLEDVDTGKVHYTNIGCRLFDDQTCTCTNYPLRKQLVKGCVTLTPENIERNAYWMPQSCAYRLLFEGQNLPDWHPLLTGDKNAMHGSGMSMQGLTVPEYEVDEADHEDYVIKEF